MKKLLFAAVIAAMAMTWNIRCDNDDDEDREAKMAQRESQKIFEDRVWIHEEGNSLYGFVFFSDQNGVFLHATKWTLFQETFWQSRNHDQGLEYKVEFPHRGIEDDMNFEVYECPKGMQFDLCADLSDNHFEKYTFYSNWDMVVDSRAAAVHGFDQVKSLRR